MHRKISTGIIIALIFLGCICSKIIYDNLKNSNNPNKCNVSGSNMSKYITRNDMEKRKDNTAREYAENLDIEDAIKKLEILLESNLVENFTFQDSEKAICYYIGCKKIDGYRIVVYKKTVEGHILFMGLLKVKKGTGIIYIVVNDEYVMYKGGRLKGLTLTLPDTAKEVYMRCEEELSEDDYELLDELLGEAFRFLKEEGIENLKIKGDGLYWFLDRKYYCFRRFVENDVQIFTLAYYCIDMENGNLYEERDYMFSYTSLYYMGNLGIGE